MEQQAKLSKCYQNNKTVREYIYELSELWNMIGDVEDHQKVTRFWTGLDATIQAELWKKELNPEMSSFHDVQNAAEIIEIAHSVPTRDRRSKDKPQNPSNTAGSHSQPTVGKQSKRQDGPPSHPRTRS
jgi:hypothetical protein